MPMIRPQVSRRFPSIPLRLPLFVVAVAAGFPSPADDYVEVALDLNEHLVKHPAATFFVRVRGHSMVGAGIHDGDLLVVDRAEEPRDGSVVVAVLAGELTVKRLRRRNGTLSLQPENDAFAPIEIPPEAEFRVWGVVIHAIHRV